ncbi:MAG: hypothetical protein NVS1B4_21710 [Gemmatimonadaceae bacterium]
MSETVVSQFTPLTELRLTSGVGDLIARRMRRVHERVAQQAEQRSPGAFGAIAVHFDRAKTNDKAYEYAILAADRARGMLAVHEAAEFLHVAERNALAPGQIAEVRARLADVAELAGKYGDALAECEQAITWYASQGERTRLLPLRRTRERLRGLLGQPFRLTLGVCLQLDEEAIALEMPAERVPLLTMVSQAHSKMGDVAAAERAASDAVALAERVADTGLLADALLRLGLAIIEQRPSESAGHFDRALVLYTQRDDKRGMARCHISIAGVHSRLSQWKQEERELAEALSLARAAGQQDLWGAAASNAGVGHLRRGEFDRARDLFCDAFALFTALQHEEHSLYVLYNLAHLELEHDDTVAALELYDVTVATAYRLGQSEVEIGALGGTGLALLRQSKVDRAAVTLRAVEERLRTRTDWFQGRELVEALRVLVAAVESRHGDAARLYADALSLAERHSAYSAAWLTATCAGSLRSPEGAAARTAAARLARAMTSAGYHELGRRLTLVTTDD